MVYYIGTPKHHPWRHPNWKIQVGVGFIRGWFTTTGVKFEDSKVASRNEVTRVFVWLLMQEILLPPRIMGSQVTGWDWNNGNGSFDFFCPPVFFFEKDMRKNAHMLHETGIFAYIYHKFDSNVGKYSIHGFYGIDGHFHCWISLKPSPESPFNRWGSNFSFTVTAVNGFLNRPFSGHCETVGMETPVPIGCNVWYIWPMNVP